MPRMPRYLLPAASIATTRYPRSAAPSADARPSSSFAGPRPRCTSAAAARPRIAARVCRRAPPADHSFVVTIGDFFFLVRVDARGQYGHFEKNLTTFSREMIK